MIDDARHVFNEEGGNKTTFRSRGYMRLILRQSLIQNHKYAFLYQITLSERSAFNVEHLFIDLSTRRLKQERNYTAELKSDNAFPLTGGEAMHNAVNWNKVSIEFVAKGEDRFVTIGLFTGGLQFFDYMKLLKTTPNPKGHGCDYFIDNIELKEL